MSKTLTATFLTVAIGLSACNAGEPADVKRTEQAGVAPVNLSSTIRFLAIGDHGYQVEGKPERSGMLPVAKDAVNNCNKTACDFALLLGDNIYPKGASGKPEDAILFNELFIKPYGDLGGGSEDFKIYTVLGNHDWQKSRKGAMAQIRFMENNAPFYMDGLSYSAKPAVGDVGIFAIDTTMLLAAQRGKPKQALPKNDTEKNQLADLAKQLEQSTAKWKFVIGHHPLWEAGGQKAEQATLMRDMVLPILCDHADAYFAGHQHTLEIHSFKCPVKAGQAAQPDLMHVVSGAAAKTRKISEDVVEAMRQAPGIEPVWTAGESYGYFAVELSGDRLEITPVLTPKKGAHNLNKQFRHALTRRFADRH